MIRLGALLAILSAGLAQDGPKFEVASIKPSDPNYQGSMMRTTAGGRVEMRGFTLKDMIINAWQVRDFQVVGGPNWIDSDRFDLEAKPDRPTRPREMSAMLRALLEDRCKLVVREETKEAPIYELVLARRDGKLGPEMKETTCQVYDKDHPQPSPTPGQPPRGCGGMSTRSGQMMVSGMPIVNLGMYLSGMLDREVVDRTGLTGRYDFTLKWTPENRRADDNAGPSIFTALQEQLGLKLESAKGPVEMLIVEHAEKPSEN